MSIFTFLSSAATVISFAVFIGIVAVGVQQAARARRSTRRPTRRSHCLTTTIAGAQIAPQRAERRS